MSEKMKEKNSFDKKSILFFVGVFFDRKRKDFNGMSKMWQTNIKINISFVFNESSNLLVINNIFINFGNFLLSEKVKYKNIW